MTSGGSPLGIASKFNPPIRGRADTRPLSTRPLDFRVTIIYRNSGNDEAVWAS
ncbi:hypothetical protein PCANC_05714, partial [Puccinia coronata f. sp. avenae]